MIIHNPLEWGETRLGQEEMFGPSTVPRSSKGGEICGIFQMMFLNHQKSSKDVQTKTCLVFDPPRFAPDQRGMVKTGSIQAWVCVCDDFWHRSYGVFCHSQN